MDTNSNQRIGPFEVYLPIHSAAAAVSHHSYHDYPGRLFIVEGIDGSGKSTQLMLLHKWLEAKG
jgi:ABC-type phosphonate transport system ATPase subunit